MEPTELQKRLQDLASSYTERLASILGDRLVSVVLFGSVARGKASIGSDLDLLIVMEDLPRGQFARKALLEPAESAAAGEFDNLETLGVTTRFSRIVKTRREAGRHVPLYLDMVEDAKLLFDKDGFFASVLAELKSHLAKLGARRCLEGSIRYWDLKPDLKPGDEFEI